MAETIGIDERARFRADVVRKDINRMVDYLIGCEIEPEYVVIGGANLLLRGIRSDAPDVDMLVSEEMYGFLKGHPKSVEKEPPVRARAMGADNMSVIPGFSWMNVPVSMTTHMGDGWYPMDYEDYREEGAVNVFQGIRLAPLEHVWDSKAAIQRDSDLLDLKLIAAATGRDPAEIPRPKVPVGTFLS